MAGRDRVRLALLLAALATDSVKAQTPISVTLLADDSAAPFSFVENGQAAGVYIDILHEAVRAMPGYTLHIDPVPWSRALAMVRGGTALGVIPPYRRPVERPWMHYSAHPLFIEHIVVLCRETVLARQATWAFPADFAGLTFANNLGSRAGGTEFHAMASHGEIILDESDATDGNIRKVLNGRADCYINDRRVARQAIAQMQAETMVPLPKITEAAIVKNEPVYIGYSTAGDKNFPHKADFITKLDAQLMEMAATGVTATIANRRIPTY